MKKRHGVLALLGAVSVITFIDRLAIAVAGPGLQRDVHLTRRRVGMGAEFVRNRQHRI